MSDTSTLKKAERSAAFARRKVAHAADNGAKNRAGDDFAVGAPHHDRESGDVVLLTTWNDGRDREAAIIAGAFAAHGVSIRAAEQENVEILSSVVPGSRLHQIIHNPIDSGIDEG